jgi:RNA polymerase sigma-70 factor (ECF subfamily)
LPLIETSGERIARPLPTLTDEELFAGVCSGSEAHFNELYGRYFPRIYAFIQARVRNRADAEELTQESFTAVFRSSEGYSGRSSPLAWIYGIARNTVNNHLRRLRAQGEKLEQVEPQQLHGAHSVWAGTPEDDLALRRRLAAMEASLEAISPWQVEVFRLRHIEDLRIGEIASRMDRSNDAIRSSLYRVKRLLVDAADAGVDR